MLIDEFNKAVNATITNWTKEDESDLRAVTRLVENGGVQDAFTEWMIKNIEVSKKDGWWNPMCLFRTYKLRGRDPGEERSNQIRAEIRAATEACPFKKVDWNKKVNRDIFVEWKKNNKDAVERSFEKNSGSMKEALFLNGVYEDGLEEIIKAQTKDDGLVCYLQPYKADTIAILRESDSLENNPLDLYISTTSNLNFIGYTAQIVGWEDKRELVNNKKRLAELNKHIRENQPIEEGIYFYSDEEKTKECVNLIAIKNLKKISNPLPVKNLIKVSDNKPHKPRTRAGGWAPVFEVPRFFLEKATTVFSEDTESYSDRKTCEPKKDKMNTARESLFLSIRSKMEDVGFLFEKEQKAHHQKRKENELKFIHPSLLNQLECDGCKVNAKKFYIKPLSDDPDCEIGLVTGKSSPIANSKLFPKANAVDSFQEAPAWVNRDNDTSLDNLLLEIERYLDKNTFPELIDTDLDLYEGVKKQVTVNMYERSSVARARCVAYHGFRCKVCGFDFHEKYGDIGKEYIHVHHVKPLHTINENYRIDYQKDLIPVCPNCHAMLHKKKNGAELSIEELRDCVRKNHTQYKG